MRNYGKFVKPPHLISIFNTFSNSPLANSLSRLGVGVKGCLFLLFFVSIFARPTSAFDGPGSEFSTGFAVLSRPSRDVENLLPGRTGGIVINEILPSPEGPDDKEEWIEIFNQNDFEVDLSSWKIADTAGKTTTYAFPKGIKIPPKGFLLLDRPKTKITLNNSGDGLNLIQPEGKIIDTVVYENSPRGQSYGRIDSKWFWSQILTPTEANIIPPPISKAKSVKSSKEGGIAPEKGLAAVGEIRDFSKFLPFLIALIAAIFSGAIILIVKNRLEG